MEPAGFIFGLVATADLCLKYGRMLITLCDDLKNADNKVQELLLLIRTVWYRIERQVLVIRSLDRVDGAFRDLQDEILQALQIKLRDTSAKVSRLSSASLLRRRITYAIYWRDSLKRSVDDLEAWYVRWDPSWFLIVRLAGPHVDNEIRRQRGDHEYGHVRALTIASDIREAHRANADPNCGPYDFLPDSVAFKELKPISFSAANVSIRSDSNNAIILDNIPYRTETNESDSARDIQGLARVLSKLDPLTCNLLRCEGVKRNTDVHGTLQGYSLIFQMPPVPEPCTQSFVLRDELQPLDQATSIRSLRGLLQDKSREYSLTFRLHVSRSIARSVIFLHSATFVHKNIRPETILTNWSGVSYLVGYQRFRYASGHTHLSGDALWQENLYRHPTRQGEIPEEMYTIRHDVYSLGVCLLEIGLWTSFVLYENTPDGTIAISPGMDQLETLLIVHRQSNGGFELKRRLISLAKERLPSRIGDRYTRLVISCLSCLDKDSSFGSDNALSSGDDDGVAEGVQYFEQILSEIESISV